MNKLLADQVVSICKEAGAAILEVYHRESGFNVESKSDDSPVTEADLAAHRVLIAGLESLVEQTPILSEESELPDYQQRSQWSRYWIIDPLDGTKEFINRNGEYTVNVALVENGLPILGVVHVPVLDITYVGVAGLGAWKIEQGKESLIQIRTLDSRVDQGLPIEVVASRRHGAQEVEDMIDALTQAFGNVTTKSMGSSLKLCLIAEGKADLYPRLALTSEWDTAAAQAVVEAAGGRVMTTEFETLKYNTKDNILNPFFFVIGDTGHAWDETLNQWRGISPE